MTALQPDLILIACNTLSVLFGSTAFSLAPAVPVTGILDQGAALFSEALVADPAGVLALFGTRTTIGSGEYLRRLTRRGIDPRRIVMEACHGLAAAVDRDPDSPGLPALVEECIGRAAPRLPAGAPLYAGLSCTHYAYVADIFRASLSLRTGARVTILDPGERLVEGLTGGLGDRRPGAKARPVSVEVLSKVGLPESQRRAVARRLGPTSAITARALLDYGRRPDLF